MWINGTIDVKNDGYFTISIPYTDGFTAEIDGKRCSVKRPTLHSLASRYQRAATA